MKLKLAMLRPEKWEGTLIPVACTPFLIGREPGCDLRAKSSTVGLRHCALLVRDHRVFVCAFAGTGGTFVNASELQGEVEVHDGDRVQAGSVTFAIRLEGQPVSTTPQPAPASSGPTEEDEAARLLLALDAQEESANATSTAPVAARGAGRNKAARQPTEPYPARTRPAGPESPDTAAAAGNLLLRYKKNYGDVIGQPKGRKA
jgi:pSer/pThr/pTyr-binding forkhead associated (FHA) protein